MSRMPDLFSPFHVVIASDHKYIFLETYLCFGKKQEKGWKLYTEFLILGLAVKFYHARSAENADISRSAVAAPHFHLDPASFFPLFSLLVVFQGGQHLGSVHASTFTYSYMWAVLLRARGLAFAGIWMGTKLQNRLSAIHSLHRPKLQ